VVGSIASNSIGFILPALFYFSLVTKKDKPINFKFYVSKAMFFFFIPFGLFAVASQYIGGE
jgi:hypothetical protein